MKAALGFALALLTGVALMYGYDFAMTADGFAVQGYIGAVIPASLVLLGAAIGGCLAS